MKQLIIIFIWSVAITFCIAKCGTNFGTSEFKTPSVEQIVIENRVCLEISSVPQLYDVSTIGLSDKSRDSIYQVWDNAMKPYTRPYKLTTTYKGHDRVDYGTAREIDSIKCIRYHEMIKWVAKMDSIDNAETLAIEKAERDKKAELERLNKKCE